MQNSNQVNQLLLFRRLAACQQRNINLVDTLRLAKIAQRLRTPPLREHHGSLPHPQPMNRLRRLCCRREGAARERKTDPRSKNDGASYVSVSLCLCDQSVFTVPRAKSPAALSN